MFNDIVFVLAGFYTRLGCYANSCALRLKNAFSSLLKNGMSFID